jgi:hypothetical protein
MVPGTPGSCLLSAACMGLITVRVRSKEHLRSVRPRDDDPFGTHPLTHTQACYVHFLKLGKRTLTGPLLKEMLRAQFTRLVSGDRFWFENPANGLFSEEERGQIRTFSYKHVVELNTGMWMRGE